MKICLRILSGMVFGALFLLGGLASAQDVFTTPEVKVVQERKYFVPYELNTQLGVAPLDSFNKSALLGLSLHKSMNYNWGWEIINVQVAHNIETSLKDNLLKDFGVEPKGILDYMRWYAVTGITVTPLYSKSLWFNESLFYSEISFVGNAGLMSFNSGETAPMAGFGVVPRFYLSNRWSLKPEARLYYHMGENKNSNLMISISVGLSYHFGDIP